MPGILHNCLDFQLHNPTPEGLSALISCEKALKDLLAYRITLADFFEILATNDVDIDGYLETIDRNLKAVGV